MRGLAGGLTNSACRCRSWFDPCSPATLTGMNGEWRQKKRLWMVTKLKRSDSDVNAAAFWAIILIAVCAALSFLVESVERLGQ